MSHSETQTHSTNLFQWLLSASSLSDRDCQSIGWRLHICQEPHFLFQSISSTSTFRLCPWWMSSREGAAAEWDKGNSGPFHFFAHIFLLCRKGCVKNHIELPALFPGQGYLACWFLYLVFTLSQIDSNHVRFLVWFGFLFRGSFKKYSVYFRKEVPSSDHGWLRVIFKVQLQPKEREIIFLPYLLHTTQTQWARITVQNYMKNSYWNYRNI